MTHDDIWLTPEQAAALSGRSMIAVRALIETTLEHEGTRHLLQIFESQDGNYESGYLLHRSLVTSEGLPVVQQTDVVERLSAKIQELEAEVEVLRFRAATVRQDPASAAPMPIVQQVRQVAPVVPVPIPRSTPDTPQAGGSGGSFWVVLGIIILLTFVIVMFILFKQGFIHLPQQS